MLNRKEKIKVVHLAEELTIGGLENVLATIALGLNKNKYDVHVWCLREGGFFANKLIEEGIDVKTFHISTSRNPLSIYKLYKHFKSHNFDLVHTHAYSAGTIGRISAFLAGIPVIISHNHSVYDYYNKYYHFFEWFLSHITDKIICVSDVVKGFTNEVQGIDTKKLLTIHNGIDVSSFASKRETTNLREELGIPINHSVICTTGHLEEQKGLGYLIKAASLVLKVKKNVSFLLVGEGSLREELKTLCKNLNIEKYIIFAGIRNNIPEILSLSDIFVLPSIREGMPLTIFEAMASSKPIIATKVGGIPEIVKDGVSGILVSPEDAEALYKAMDMLLNNNEQIEKMGSNGKKICAENFNSKIMMGKIEDLYDSLVAKKVKHH